VVGAARIELATPPV